MPGLISTAGMILRDMKVYWRLFIIIITPIILSPLIIIHNRPEAKCGYVVAIMAVYWIFEVLPLTITAFLPMVLYPVLGVVKGKDLARFYIQDTTMVFFAGLMIALAMENVNLHKRIGTGILLKIGTTPSRILIGIILPTWLLSMFISNTAATSMMVSAADAVVKQLALGMKKSKMRLRGPTNTNVIRMEDKDGRKNEAFEMAEELGNANPLYKDNGVIIDATNNNNNNNNDNNNNNENNNNVNYSYDNDKVFSNPFNNNNKNNNNKNNENKYNDDNNAKYDDESSEEEIMASIQLDHKEQTKIDHISQMLSLAIAYSANIGGTGTLTGTPTNLLVADAAERAFRKHNLESPVNYASWIFFALPHSIICIILLYSWFQLYYLKCGCFRADSDFKEGESSLKVVMRDEYKKLGVVSFGEVATSILLVVMVVLWLVRDPGFVDGYSAFFRKGYVTDSTPAIFMVLLLFIIPMERPDWLCWREDKRVRARKRRSLLTWQEVSTRLPWGPVFLLGGGFAMAEGCRRSGLTELIGGQLASLSSLQPWIIALIITITISFITEIMSNTAVMSLFLPILDAMANDLSINPLLLMLPAGLAASYAFMLPIATPPNAIVFSCGSLTVIQMIKVGFILNCLCIVTVTLGINTWGNAIFNLKTLPWQLNISNMTSDVP